MDVNSVKQGNTRDVQHIKRSLGCRWWKTDQQKCRKKCRKRIQKTCAIRISIYFKWFKLHNNCIAGQNIPQDSRRSTGPGIPWSPRVSHGPMVVCQLPILPNASQLGYSLKQMHIYIYFRLLTISYYIHLTKSHEIYRYRCTSHEISQNPFNIPLNIKHVSNGVSKLLGCRSFGISKTQISSLLWWFILLWR